MKYPRFIRTWAQRQLERMLPSANADLDDARAELARLQRAERAFGGRRRAILDQERRVERARRRVEKMREALGEDD